MRRFEIVFALTAVVALVGQARAAEPAVSAGVRPSQAEAVRIGEEAIRERLFDPEAGRIEWPYAFTSGTLKSRFGKPTAGFWTCGRINAKNRYGAYTGQTWFMVMINNGVVNSLDIGTPGEVSAATASCPDFLKNGQLQPSGPDAMVAATPQPAIGPQSKTSGSDVAAISNSQPIATFSAAVTGPPGRDPLITLQRAHSVLLEDGFSISQGEAASVIVTSAKPFGLKPAEADCGKSLGISYLLDRRAKSTLAYRVTASGAETKVEVVLNSVYEPSYGAPSKTLSCTSSGLLERTLLKRIAE